MKILYSPQFNDENKIEYTFFGEIIKVEMSTLVENEEKSNFELDSVFYYDLSSVKEGGHTQSQEPIISAKRVDSEMIVELLMYIGSSATKEERFPEWQDVEFEDFEIPEDAEIIQLEELIIPEPEPSPVDNLIRENSELKKSVDSLRSSMIQSNKNTEDLIVTLLSMM